MKIMMLFTKISLSGISIELPWNKNITLCSENICQAKLYCSFLAVFLIGAASLRSEGGAGLPVSLSGVPPVVCSHHPATFHLMVSSYVMNFYFLQFLHLFVSRSTLPWMPLSSSGPSRFLWWVCPGTSWQTVRAASPVCPASLPCRQQYQRWRQLWEFKLIILSNIWWANLSGGPWSSGSKFPTYICFPANISSI